MATARCPLAAATCSPLSRSRQAGAGGRPDAANTAACADTLTLHSSAARSNLRRLSERARPVSAKQAWQLREPKSGVRSSPDACRLTPDACAVIRLDTIFRQADGSYIVDNAHRVVRGQMPVTADPEATDFLLARFILRRLFDGLPELFHIWPQRLGLGIQVCLIESVCQRWVGFEVLEYEHIIDVGFVLA